MRCPCPFFSLRARAQRSPHSLADVHIAHVPQYLDVITKVWGDWTLFQQLLTVLRQIGDRHGGASIANIAVRWVLDHPFVGAVLVGASNSFSLFGSSLQNAYDTKFCFDLS